MRPTDRVAEVVGNLPGKVVKMGLDASSIEHIMSVLTDLYSDPALAVIREYSTNAYDSHIEAGVKKPIEVSTPTPISQFLRIRDYGVGLSVDEITRIYSQYGASTKRDTDEQTGMLGLGSKSALTYTNQFTMTSVKNGVRVVVSVSRETDGTGSMTIVDTRATDEPNGVEITIPASTTSGMLDKAKKFFSFWPKGSYLLNGETVEPATKDYDEVSPGIFVKVHSGYNTLSDYVVMGGVAYPVQPAFLDRRNWSFIAYVNIGDVDFTPSREGLHYTARTKETLKRVCSVIEKKLLDKVRAAIEGAETFGEAFRLRQKYSAIIPHSAVLKYRKQNIPSSISLHGHTVFVIRPYSGRGKYSFYDYEAITAAFDDYAILIVPEGFTWSTARKAKVARWRSEKSIRNNKFIIATDIKEIHKISPFLDELKVFKWEDVQVDKTLGVYSYSLGPQKVNVYSWNAKTNYVTGESTSDLGPYLANDKNVYVHFSPAEKLDGNYVNRVVTEFKVVAVELSAGRHAKFSRDTGSVHIKKFVEAKCENLKKQITLVDKIKMTIDSSGGGWYAGCVKNKISASDIDDDDLATWVSAAHAPYSPECATWLKFNARTHDQKDPLKKYILIGKVNVWGSWDKAAMKHSLHYINAAYAAEKDKS